MLRPCEQFNCIRTIGCILNNAQRSSEREKGTAFNSDLDIRDSEVA